MSDTEIMLVDIPCKGTKEMHELMKASSRITASILEKAVDGLTVAEIVTSLTENVSSVIAAADGAEKVIGEAKAQPGAFARSILVPGTDILDAVMEFKKAKESLKVSAMNEGGVSAPPVEEKKEAEPETPPAE
jgi:Ca2+/Na+ antiporter